MKNKNFKIIVLQSAYTIGNKLNSKLKEIFNTNDDFIIKIKEYRFGNGEGKVIIDDDIQNMNIYILCDVGNYNCKYNLYGFENRMSPDDHYMNIKRTISAMKGRAKTINVIMPLLYGSRQHRRKYNESLDCAMALQDLFDLGVDSIITFDAHDPNVQNAIPCKSFENFYPTNSILNFFTVQKNIDLNNLLVVSPDTGAIDRARYYADLLKSDVGVFYKKRDLSKVVNGKNPIVAHEYMGKDVKGKNIIVVDDIIASGNSMIEVSEKLKNMGANKIYLIASFGLFTESTKNFDDAYNDGFFDMLCVTNLTYVPEEIRKKTWYMEVDCSNDLLDIIYKMNHNL